MFDPIGERMLMACADSLGTRPPCIKVQVKRQQVAVTVDGPAIVHGAGER
ncbi:MAG: hypothetical protein ABI212_09285 [Burkholderiaceae bacterium]